MRAVFRDHCLNPRTIALYSAGPTSGKSEVARLLREKHSFVPIKLAEPMKAMISTLLITIGVAPQQLPWYLEGDLKEVPIPELGNKTPRWMFQTLGTEWGRELIDQRIWTNICLGRCQREHRWGNSVVVDDMRFPNEFEALKGAGALMVKVTRPGVTIPTGHPSEGLLEDVLFDYEIVNDGSLDDLAASVSILMKTEFV